MGANSAKLQVRLNKGSTYTLVIVNVSQAQLDDEKNRLFLCLGGMPETSEEKQATNDNNSHVAQLLIEYLPSDFTQIGDFHNVEGVGAQLLMNSRREESEITYTDYFMPKLHFVQHVFEAASTEVKLMPFAQHAGAHAYQMHTGALYAQQH